MLSGDSVSKILYHNQFTFQPKYVAEYYYKTIDKTLTNIIWGVNKHN